MDAKFLARTLGLTLGASSLVWAFACSGDESLGRDENAAQRGSMAGTTSNPDPNCETIQCFRPVECVERCGGPIVQSSCCPCPDGLLDELIECSGNGGAGSPSTGGNTGSGGFSGSTNVPLGGEGGYSMGGAPGGEAGAPGTVEPDLDQLHVNCVDGACPADSGLTAMEYYGIAGPSGPLFCSCEIPCDQDPNSCPATTVCVTISDGPGQVCDLQ